MRKSFIFFVLFFCSIILAYNPPIGVPNPNFGIDQNSSMYACATYDFGNGPESYKTLVSNGITYYYTHYVDDCNPAANDNNNPYGTVAFPRETFRNLSLSPGSVVLVNGGCTYGLSYKFFYWQGTAEKPIMLIGLNKPTITASTLYFACSHFILDGFNFNNQPVTVRSETGNTVHHVTVKNCSFTNCNLSSHGAFLGAVTYDATWVKNVVFYNNIISGLIDTSRSAATFPEIDEDGIYIGRNTDSVWILNNHIWGLKGDAIGGAHNINYSAKNYWIGFNDAHHCGENGFDVKEAENIVVSQNKFYSMYGKNQGSGTGGVGIVAHYGPNYSTRNCWILFNEIYNCADIGIQIGGAQAHPVYCIGNIIRDVTNLTQEGAGYRTWGCQDLYFKNNIFQNCDKAVVHTDNTSGSRLIFENNVVTGVNVNYMVISGAGPINNSIIKNNLFYDIERSNISWDNINYSVSNFNNINTRIFNNIEADPKFISSTNFNVQEISPCIDGGVNDTLRSFFNNLFDISINYDYDGKIVPFNSVIDIGIMEYGSIIIIDTADTFTDTTITDTIINNDTVYVTIHDTIVINDTLILTNTIYDTITNTVHDTIINNIIVHDTVTLINTIHDTIINNIYLTDTLVNTIYDTTIIKDTVELDSLSTDILIQYQNLIFDIRSKRLFNLFIQD